jgi:hypothetical protein
MGATSLTERHGVELRRRTLFRRARAATAKVPWTLLLGVVLAAEIVVWTGVATNWFGPVPGVPGTTSPGPNPNPYNETVAAVIANVTYTGNLSGYFPALQNENVCGHCPALPFMDDNYTPAVAGFWFYFNVTNNAAYYETFVNFTLTTSGANPQLFTPGYVRCCYPGYESYAAQVGFTPGMTWGVEAFVYAASLPNVGPSGFVLYFNVTAPYSNQTYDG